ncbi:2-oxo-4-hydroxy-4-carboxy-5-ureidoimidazoline decarboxylase [Paenibacillus sp. OV219]|uniref:2-oxo-4-hydroxy-4-carboxy-5-ureidoimidazoline decarboxylase n=1 Tax=Paenibacillus sp. OV219 TaxID=1884377 RepID=UPI0008D06A82|nr:2-oxo-4-hydroxy-4-carboxy-5-ureidoimidazoline decarboxylase [Paenibacillus sp. OV219]SEM86672.1 2-oxo-4-hydroxy-4-carboxy-5-ureidoimidazoline decarboxylase [Paenibacillus sp. OV219]
MNDRLQLWQLNTMSRELFTQQLGGIFEHSPWVAERAWGMRPFHSLLELHEAMIQVAREAPEEQVLTLLRAHPDLAARIQMTAYSEEEQTGAGLQQLTPEEFSRFTELNAAYMRKFGFPFIIAVYGKSKSEIAAAMAVRLEHSAAQERRQALLEIQRISWLRIQRSIEE